MSVATCAAWLADMEREGIALATIRRRARAEMSNSSMVVGVVLGLVFAVSGCKDDQAPATGSFA